MTNCCEGPFGAVRLLDRPSCGEIYKASNDQDCVAPMSCILSVSSSAKENCIHRVEMYFTNTSLVPMLDDDA